VQFEDQAISDRLGRVVGGRWTLERLLGVGGMAAVYHARSSDGTSAALKFLHPEMARRSDVRERFLREAYAANRIGHPGVVQVLEHGGANATNGEETYLVMELLVGETLSDRVRRLGTLPVDELLDYLDQVLDVLVAAHDRGIVHRDLKPDNLFITESGRLKVLDFGLARLIADMPGDFQTRTGVALGTLPYMAPEQALGRRAEIDGRVDLFALGATVFRILSGRKVHEANSEAELLMAMASKPAPSLASVAPSISPDVCKVVDLALAFSRLARYPDARTMQEDVRAVRAGRPPPHAGGHSAAREQATRLEMPAVPAPAQLAASAMAVATDATPPSEQPTRMDQWASIGRDDTIPAPPPSSTASVALPLPAQVQANAVAEQPGTRFGLALILALAGLLLIAAIALVALLSMGADDASQSDATEASSDESQSSSSSNDPAAEPTAAPRQARSSVSSRSDTAAPTTERANTAPTTGAFTEPRGRGHKRRKKRDDD
jgi:serine/threonine protein kinase